MIKLVFAQGHGQTWCNGDCRWSDGVCRSKESSKESNKESSSTGEAPGDGSGLWEGEQVVMTSVDNEKFACRLPRVDPLQASGAGDYTGPTVLGLLEKLFTQQACAYRLESYWTYELCHGRFLRQYHEERDGKQIKVQEYSLGKFTKEMFDELVVEQDKDLAGGITRHPATKKIEGMNMPYYEVTMTNGDLCDLNKQPRKVRVLYVCYPSGKNEVRVPPVVPSCSLLPAGVQPEGGVHLRVRGGGAHRRPLLPPQLQAGGEHGARHLLQACGRGQPSIHWQTLSINLVQN